MLLASIAGYSTKVTVHNLQFLEKRDLMFLVLLPSVSLLRINHQFLENEVIHQPHRNKKVKERLNNRIVTSAPLVEIQLNTIRHLTTHIPDKGSCSNCKKSIICIMCAKCDVYLCLNPNRNVTYTTKSITTTRLRAFRLQTFDKKES